MNLEWKIITRSLQDFWKVSYKERFPNILHKKFESIISSDVSFVFVSDQHSHVTLELEKVVIFVIIDERCTLNRQLELLITMWRVRLANNFTHLLSKFEINKILTKHKWNSFPVLRCILFDYLLISSLTIDAHNFGLIIVSRNVAIATLN